MQRQIDAVDVFPAKRRVEHDRRKRMGHGIAGDAINLGGGIELVDAVGLAQGAGGKLSGAGLFAGSDGGEGELTSGAQ